MSGGRVGVNGADFLWVDRSGGGMDIKWWWPLVLMSPIFMEAFIERNNGEKKLHVMSE